MKITNPEYVLSKKLMYFVHMGHDPMNSNPGFTTPWWDPLIKPDRIVINLFLDDKMGSPPTLNKIGVMFSVHGDPV